MIQKFDLLGSDGGSSVLYDNSNILSNTLLISLSIIVLNEEDINHFFASKITII